MHKEQVAAIVIGLIFVVSMAGFAFSGMNIFPQQQPSINISNIVDRELTQGEKIYILQTGRVLIEDFYVQGCTPCEIDRATLEAFTQEFSEFVILEEVEVNSTNETSYVKLQMIGRTGLIEDLRDVEITRENLVDIFCDISLVQPRECLLMDI